MLIFQSFSVERIAQTRLRKMLASTALVALIASTSSATAEVKPLSLAEALQRSLSQNPRLQRYPFMERRAEALRLQASLQPTPTLKLSVANVLGNDEFSATDSAETTLGLSQLIELGDKRQARIGLSDARWQQTLANYELARLELLAETGRRYYKLLNTQTYRKQLSERARLEQSALAIIKRRVNAGAVGAADAAKMELKLGQTELQLLQLNHQLQQQQSELSSLWLKDVDYSSVEGNLFKLPAAIDIALLLQKLDRSPLIQQKIRLSQLADAEVTREKSRSSSDLTVGFGVRDFQSSNSQALVFDLSMPLTLSNPNRGRLAAAYSEQQWAHEDRELKQRELALALKSLSVGFDNRRMEATRLGKQLLPKAQELLKEVERGYQRGIYSVLQWIDAQDELFALKQQQLQLHTTLYLQRLEVERISGQALDTQPKTHPSHSAPEA